MHWFVGSPAPFMAFITANMPQDNPGSLDPKTYADIAAYLMSKNRVPAGNAELVTDPDALANVTLPPLQ
jgi:cytochrome c